MPQTIATSKSSISQPLWLTILRIVLGIILIWKGYNFIMDTAHLQSMIEQTGVGVFSKSSGVLTVVVSTLTLLCGFFITVGLFTRASCFVQIPIVILAIIFVHTRNIEGNSFDLILTIIVLGLLVLFAIKGSGQLSADEYFRIGAALDKKESETF